MKRRLVILFDGVCNLCNASVRFIIRHDPLGLFVFAPLQSSAGHALTHQHRINPDLLDTLIVIIDDQVYTRSTAALMIVRHLQKPWPMLYGLILLPAKLRDGIYTAFARNRYRLFGRQDVCMRPTAEMQDRFLSG